MELPDVSIFVDDGGTTGHDEGFVVGAFCTKNERRWRLRFQGVMDTLRYHHTLHFAEIGTKPGDGRYRVSKRLLAVLAAHGDWSGNYTYINRAWVTPARFSGSAQIEYNKWVADLIRFRTALPGFRYRVMIAHRDRDVGDTFIPDGLQAELTRAHLAGAPEVTLAVRANRDDRLLQIADLITSGVRQRHWPSTNPNKLELAGLIDSMVQGRGPDDNRRIRPFEWMPKELLAEKEEGRHPSMDATP